MLSPDNIVRPSKAFLVIAAWRPSWKTLSTFVPKDTLVLDRDKMRALYGETLSSVIELAEMNEKYAVDIVTDVTLSTPSSLPKHVPQL